MKPIISFWTSDTGISFVRFVILRSCYFTEKTKRNLSSNSDLGILIKSIWIPTVTVKTRCVKSKLVNILSANNQNLAVQFLGGQGCPQLDTATWRFASDTSGASGTCAPRCLSNPDCRLMRRVDSVCYLWSSVFEGLLIDSSSNAACSKRKTTADSWFTGMVTNNREGLLTAIAMGLLPDTQNCWCACAGNAGNVFPVTAGKRSRHASRHVRHARAVMHAGVAN